MSWRGLWNRVRSPSSAITVTAAMNWTPRRAWMAVTTGYSRHGFLLVQLRLQPLQPLVLPGDGAHVLLEDDLLRGGRTHHFGQPAQVGGAPAGPAFVAEILAQQEGLQPVLGRFEIPHGVLA